MRASTAVMNGDVAKRMATFVSDVRFMALKKKTLLKKTPDSPISAAVIRSPGRGSSSPSRRRASGARISTAMAVRSRSSCSGAISASAKAVGTFMKPHISSVIVIGQ